METPIRLTDTMVEQIRELINKAIKTGALYQLDKIQAEWQFDSPVPFEEDPGSGQLFERIGSMDMEDRKPVLDMCPHGSYINFIAAIVESIVRVVTYFVPQLPKAATKLEHLKYKMREHYFLSITNSSKECNKTDIKLAYYIFGVYADKSYFTEIESNSQLRKDFDDITHSLIRVWKDYFPLEFNEVLNPKIRIKQKVAESIVTYLMELGQYLMNYHSHTKITLDSGFLFGFIRNDYHYELPINSSDLVELSKRI